MQKARKNLQLLRTERHRFLLKRIILYRDRVYVAKPNSPVFGLTHPPTLKTCFPVLLGTTVQKLLHLAAGFPRVMRTSMSVQSHRLSYLPGRKAACVAHVDDS
jgi:hypothetical protein